MTAQIINGKEIAKNVRESLRNKLETVCRDRVPPTLAVILVGDDPASQIYVRNKVKACGDAGIRSIMERLPADTTEEQLLALLDKLNKDDEVDGILVQLPLPSHLDERKVIKAISAEKDVDGFHLENVGAMTAGMPGFRPCTPKGVMTLLKTVGVDPAGKNAVVIGRSNIVGKPMALLLLEANATVTITHSKTRNLAELTRAADIVVAAVGRPHTLTKDMVKPGAVVIDVGINRDENNKLCGDVDFAGVSEVASWITPVPGGVGPMTIATLLSNTVDGYLKKHGLE